MYPSMVNALIWNDARGESKMKIVWIHVHEAVERKEVYAFLRNDLIAGDILVEEDATGFYPQERLEVDSPQWWSQVTDELIMLVSPYCKSYKDYPSPMNGVWVIEVSP